MHVYDVFKFSTISVCKDSSGSPGGTHRSHTMSGSVREGEGEEGEGGVCVMFSMSRWIKEVG